MCSWDKSKDIRWVLVWMHFLCLCAQSRTYNNFLILCSFPTVPGHALQPVCLGLQLWSDARSSCRRRDRQDRMRDPDEQRTHWGVWERRREPHQCTSRVSHQCSPVGEKRTTLFPAVSRHHVCVLGSWKEHEARRERTHLQYPPENSKEVSKCQNLRCDQREDSVLRWSVSEWNWKKQVQYLFVLSSISVKSNNTTHKCRKTQIILSQFSLINYSSPWALPYCLPLLFPFFYHQLQFVRKHLSK